MSKKRKSSRSLNMDLSPADQCFKNMNEFQKKRIHCDVTITVGGKEFTCHRVVLSSASAYFSIMFNGDFDESKTENITLKGEMDAVTFDGILNAIYTSNISLTQQNACHLWKACSFLGMPVFEKICVDYVKENLPVDHLVEVCQFADMLKENALLNSLVSYIAGNIAELSTKNEFSQLSFNILKLIFSQKNLVRDGSNDDLVFSIIVAWAKQKSDENVKSCIKELLQTAKLTKISVEVMVELIANPSTFTGCPIAEQTSENSDAKLQIVSKKSSTCETLKLYVKAFNKDRCVKDTIVLEYNGQNKWNPIENFNSSFDNMKTIIIESRQYFLTRDRHRNSALNSYAFFWMVENGNYTRLREPPLITKRYQLAAIGNTIYLYCSLEGDLMKSTDEKSKSCLFAYNCDLDVWSPSIPEMINLVKKACFATHNNMLYIVDGLSVSTNTINKETGVQTFDYRCSKWFSKPGLCNFMDAAACVYNNKLYVSGSYGKDGFYTFSNNYDLIAEKWSTTTFMKFGRADHVFIPFNNFLYAIDNREHSSVEKFNPNNRTWYDESPLPTQITFNNCTMVTCDVVDAVVQ